jgi:hypothetical protein
MEQTKLENQIKNKLNQRSMTPAAASWDRLDAMLSIAEPSKSELKNPKRNWGWMYIAASFLGFVLIATVYFSQTETMIDAGKIPSGVSKNQLVVNQTKLGESKTRLTLNQTQLGESKTRLALNQTQLGESKTRLALNKTQLGESKTRLVVNQTQLGENKTRLANEPIINQKNNPIAVDLKSSESQNPEVKSSTTETIKPKYISSNVLLASVQPATDVEKPIRKSDLKIDPKGLLSEVEGELNQTFRETTLERISRNFKTIRTAVANRNKE